MKQVFDRAIQTAWAVWGWFDRRSLFFKLMLIIPMICAVALMLLVGNMGLALLGTAYAVSAFWTGLIGGACTVILGKAGVIILKDRKK